MCLQNPLGYQPCSVDTVHIIWVYINTTSENFSLSTADTMLTTLQRTILTSICHKYQPLKCQSRIYIYIYIWNLNLVITALAEGLAAAGVIPSEGTVLTEKLTKFQMNFSAYQWVSHYHGPDDVIQNGWWNHTKSHSTLSFNPLHAKLFIRNK